MLGGCTEWLLIAQIVVVVVMAGVGLGLELGLAGLAEVVEMATCPVVVLSERVVGRKAYHRAEIQRMR